MAKNTYYSKVDPPNPVKRITGTNGMGKVQLHNSYAQQLIQDYVDRIKRNADAMKKKGTSFKGKSRKK